MCERIKKINKILVIHNFHRSGSPSGDDLVFKKETELLEKYGHKVIKYNPSNDEFYNGTVKRKMSIILQIPWSFVSYYKIKQICKTENPDIAHVHNFFPLLSPSIYYALYSARIPIVQTLHDYRILCPNSFFLKKNSICTLCKNGAFYNCIKNKCFNDSRIQSIPIALMDGWHNMMATFKRKIDAYICLTSLQKEIFVDAGFGEEKVFIKPNFVEDDFYTGEYRNGDYVVFIGRLGTEKGLETVIDAWGSLPDVPLKIVGVGPQEDKYKDAVIYKNIKNIEFLGFRPHQECMEILDGARFLIMPSIWLETFGLSIIEAFSHAKPIIASNCGSMTELVKDRDTGLFFEPKNSCDLANKVRWLWQNNEQCIQMAKNARREYEEKYTPKINYEILMGIYEIVLKKSETKS